MIQVLESRNTLEIHSRLPTGQRILLLVLGLFPLIAPYELLILPDWHDYASVAFLVAAVISVGAMFVSAFLLWSAIAGTDTEAKFDRDSQTLAYRFGAPVLPWRSSVHDTGSIDRLHVRKHNWSDGAPSYSLAAVLADGTSLRLGSSWSAEEVDRIADQVSRFIRS
jgi:5-enolpyruvylshikimate-3-phosphate synthase